MPVLENMGINGVSSSSNRAEPYSSNDVDLVQLNQALMQLNDCSLQRSNDEVSKAIVNPDDKRHDQQPKPPLPPHSSGDVDPEVQGAAVMRNSVQTYQLADELRRNVGDNVDQGFKREIRGLEEMISKLNPLAEEFTPPWMKNHRAGPPAGAQVAYADNFLMQPTSIVYNGNTVRRKKNGYSHVKLRMSTHTSMAQQQDAVKKTVYVSEIDHMVTEEQLATLFINCGQVIDCRICGDPNSILRFAFVEFSDEEGARNALTLSGTMLGYYPVKILPSKTAIAPVNPTLLPRSEDEREMCVRTIYCTNIDKKVTQADVKLFFESNCGEVHRLRLLGDYHHSTRIAFVEFIMAESAIAALNCSGGVLGTLPIRVSPSKTPVRPRAPRTPMQ